MSLSEGFLLAFKSEGSLDCLWGWSCLAAGLSRSPFASNLFVFETLGLAYSWQNFSVFGFDQRLLAS